MVGIVNADQLLNRCDFRAHERAFQMLSQVAGRAGRRGSRRRVVLQTRQPDLPVVRQVVADDYQAMYKSEMADRRIFRFPPRSAPDHHLSQAPRGAHRRRHRSPARRLVAAAFRRRFARSRQTGGGLRPVAAHSQVVVESFAHAEPRSVRATLLAARDRVLAHSACRNVTIYFDVDPM